MTDIEQKNVEAIAWWWAEGTKKEYEDVLKWKEIGKAETEEDRKKAEEILEKMQWASWEETKKETIKKDNWPLPHDVEAAINKLNRPEAKEGIKQSYANIDATIKNSKNEKWIAGFLGKIMNKILG